MTEAPALPPSHAARLLLTEAAALPPLLRTADPAHLDRPTCLPGWSVRDVLAHCSAALGHVAGGTVHGFSPAENQADVDERAPWPVTRLLDELEANYPAAADAIAAAGGRLDPVALGEWVHGGDVREALGLPHAYASDGLDLALPLLAGIGRARGVPATDVVLVDAGPHPGALRLGPLHGPAAHLTTDAATLVRLTAGRAHDPSALVLDGAEPATYRIFS